MSGFANGPVGGENAEIAIPRVSFGIKVNSAISAASRVGSVVHIRPDDCIVVYPATGVTNGFQHQMAQVESATAGFSDAVDAQGQLGGGDLQQGQPAGPKKKTVKRKKKAKHRAEAEAPEGATASAGEQMDRGREFNREGQLPRSTSR